MTSESRYFWDSDLMAKEKAGTLRMDHMDPGCFEGRSAGTFKTFGRFGE